MKYALALTGLLLASCASIVKPVVEGDFALEGMLTQGGLTIGQAPPDAIQVRLGGKPVPVGSDGRFLIGFGPDAPEAVTIEAVLASGGRLRRTLRIEPRDFPVDHIPTLPPRPTADPDYERLRAQERARIQAARAQSSDLPNWRETFVWPARGRISGVYGARRILGGVELSPHGGIDIAAPAGTTVVAPAGGRVVLASPPAFSLEGNLLIIDHGFSLFSAFLHLSQVDVKAGDIVLQGQPIGAIGASGRATGPHLHWGVNWGTVRVDPELLAGPMRNEAVATAQ